MEGKLFQGFKSMYTFSKLEFSLNNLVFAFDI
jgi:hypothetical protein